MAGDSTMSIYPTSYAPQTGWGQVLGQFFDSKVEIHDLAAGGRSTMSFMKEGRWGKLVDQLQKGDFVVIQFGHNDESSDPNRHTGIPDYKLRLKQMTGDVRKAGATPLITTPVSRHSAKGGVLVASPAAYAQAAREQAQEDNAVLVDLQKASVEYYNSLGLEGSLKLFLWLDAGQYPHFPNGSKDQTHFRREGAVEIARLWTGQLRNTSTVLVGRLCQNASQTNASAVAREPASRHPSHD